MCHSLIVSSPEPDTTEVPCSHSHECLGAQVVECTYRGTDCEVGDGRRMAFECSKAGEVRVPGGLRSERVCKRSSVENLTSKHTARMERVPSNVARGL